MQIGKKIRERRKQLGLSLRDLAAQVDLTASFLSQIERDEASPSIESLRRISKGLDVPIFYFLMESQQPDPVVRSDQRRRMVIPQRNITYELLVPDINRKMEVILAELDPGDGEIPLIYHANTEEFVFILQGELEISLGGEIYHLKAGDSIYFEGIKLHHMAVKGTVTLRYISVITPPVF